MMNAGLETPDLIGKIFQFYKYFYKYLFTYFIYVSEGKRVRKSWIQAGLTGCFSSSVGQEAHRGLGSVCGPRHI